MMNFVVDSTAQMAPTLWITAAALLAASATLIGLAIPPLGIERFARVRMPFASEIAALVLGFVAAAVLVTSSL